MLKSLNYYAGAAREAIKNDTARDATYHKIHEAVRGIFTMPPELTALPWIQDRKFVSTAPGDAINAAVRTFAARLPDISIQPLSEAPEEYERVDTLEEVMKWEFSRMNAVGRKSPHWKIVEYAMKYCAVAIETTYLPVFYKGRENEPRVKEILRSHCFRWNVHDPTNIHVRESDDTLEAVVNCYVMTAQEIIDKFGVDNPGVQKMLEGIEDDPHALNQTTFSFYDYTDWEARCQWIAPNGGSFSINRDAPDGIELMRKERTVSFLPWVFIDNEEPLLRQMVDAGLWENVNILRAMQFSKAVDMAAHPEYWIRTPDGTLRSVSIDSSNPNQPIVTGPGVDISKLPPPGLDPQLATLTTLAEQEVFRTTVAQILASVEKYAGTQNFSVVNAMISAAIAQLSLAQMVVERAETAALIQNFKWIDETGIPLVAYRGQTRGEGKPRGQEIAIRKGDFDPDYLYLSVKLNPATIMDKQTAINNAINAVERLGKSLRMAWDELGWENYELSEAQKAEETLFQAHMQAAARAILMQPEVAAQQQAQMQQMQRANPAPGGPQSQFEAMQGFANRGGVSAAMPGQGREQLTGQTASGEQIA